jgi:hypothetical protein
MNWTGFLRSAITGMFVIATPVKAEVMIGAFVAGNAWDEQEIVDLNDQLPKSMAFINVFSSFSESWDHLYWQSSKIVDQGMVPMISWMPIDLSRQDTNILPEILLGNWDSYKDLWSANLIAWVNHYPEDNKPSIMLRFGHEFNGIWYSYGDSPVWYKAAWQYIHDRFETSGANEHIEWVWNANNVNVDSINDITQYYPGDDYVDWTSIDGYNWGSNYAWTSWDSFTDVFSPTYSTLVTNYPDKPIVIAEVGSADPSDTPNPNWGQNGDDSDYLEDKDQWTSDLLYSIENEFPAIRAVALFNIDKELRWSLTEPTSAGLQGYTNALQSSHYVGEFLAFTSDTTPPSVNLTYPLNESAPSDNLDISGVFTDDISGIARIRVSIDKYDSSPRLYWKGTSIGWANDTTTKWRDANIDHSGGTWTLPNIDFSAAGQYRIRLYSKDYAGNTTEISSDFVNVFHTDIPDSTPPTATTVFPVDTVLSSTDGIVYGTSEDDMAGVHKILACIDRYDEQQRLYWNGSAAGWQTSKLWHTTTLDQSTGNWSLSGIDLSVPGNYRVRLYLKDKAGNTDLVTANYFSITTTDTSPLIADVTAPTATTIYPVSTIPPSTSAVIRGSAVDDVSGVEKIRVSLDRYDVD